MSKKSELIYKIITILTLAVPLPLYLFLSATIFNIQADYEITTNIDNVLFVESQDNVFVYTLDTQASLNGIVVYNDTVNHYGFLLNYNDVLKAGKGYYSYDQSTNSFNDVKRLEIQRQMAYKLPMVFFISIFGALIVLVVINKKMQWHLKYPRIAVLVALLTGTITLYLLSTILGNILNVFLIATLSWGLYLIEYYIRQNIINGTESEKVDNDLKAALKKALE